MVRLLSVDIKNLVAYSVPQFLYTLLHTLDNEVQLCSYHTRSYGGEWAYLQLLFIHLVNISFNPIMF